MFICSSCFDPKKDERRSFLDSYGPCEICHETKVCMDVEILHNKGEDISPEKVVFT